MEKARQVLEGEVKSYDYFLTGQCYGFQLFREDVEVDSCWGFLGEIRDVQDDVKRLSAGGLRSGYRGTAPVPL